MAGSARYSKGYRRCGLHPRLWVLVYTVEGFVVCSLYRAPNDGLLPNALKRCFRLSGVL